MTFELPDMMPLIVTFVVAVALTVATIAFAVVDIARRNRPVRLARHESVPRYYGRLVLGH